MNLYDQKSNTRFPLPEVFEKGSIDSEQAVNKFSEALGSDYVC
ncbi:hypothetical protein J2750_002270 [Methanococcoides alaskense]|uniref:Uncharacterized protein n=1 Tax=Methanococcoides alaskense TaxID=325778 RepID=A0AA90ZDS7_9EURY|nr:hypothetical protein [Methanococcoides alaskense]